MNEKRLFLGCDFLVPWSTFPEDGRIIPEEHRHLTLLFLGNLEEDIDFPKPSFHVAPAGIFDSCLFLPEKNPRAVSWHIDWKSGKEEYDAYLETLTNFAREKNIETKFQNHLPHVTVARDFQNPEMWKEAFHPLPVFLKDFHLYESLGNSTYKKLWTQPLLSAVTEKEHTADIAYTICGRTISELHTHAELALADAFPEILRFYENPPREERLEDVIIALNELVHKADSEIGCPFKAVSFHGDLHEEKNHFCWEMIIDV